MIDAAAGVKLLAAAVPVIGVRRIRTGSACQGDELATAIDATAGGKLLARYWQRIPEELVN